MKKIFTLLVACLLMLSGQVMANTPSDGLDGAGIPAWIIAGLEANQDSAVIDAAEWYAQAVSRDLPALGDEWFIPGFIEDSLSAYIEHVAYIFVQYLSEGGKLESLMELYQQGLDEMDAAKIREADYIRAVAWASFVGSDVNTPDIIFQSAFGDEIGFFGGFLPVEVGFFAIGDYIWYFFSPNSWTREYIHNYVRAGDESTRFLGDFLGYNPTEIIFAVIQGDESIDAGAGGFAISSARLIFVNTGVNVPPFILTHELAHIVIGLHPDIKHGGLPLAPRNFMPRAFDDEFNVIDINFHDIRVNGLSLNEFTLNDDISYYIQAWVEEEFAYDIVSLGFSSVSLFEEGLCVVLEHLFLYYTENDWYAEGLSPFIFWHGILDEETGIIYMSDNMRRQIDVYNAIGGFDYLEDFIAVMSGEIDLLLEYLEYTPSAYAPNRRATREEIIASVHARALVDKATYDFLDTEYFGERYGILNGYFTAGSFIFYLLEHRGTLEDFMKIYSDFSQMEYVYGVTMDEMIIYWLAYLDTRFSPELLEFFEWQSQFNARYEEFIMQWMQQMMYQMMPV